MPASDRPRRSAADDEPEEEEENRRPVRAARGARRRIVESDGDDDDFDAPSIDDDDDDGDEEAPLPTRRPKRARPAGHRCRNLGQQCQLRVVRQAAQHVVRCRLHDLGPRLGQLEDPLSHWVAMMLVQVESV